MTATALIVDDEPLARRRLRELIAEVDWLDVVGEAQTAPQAREMIDSARPDVCFLDVEMPGGPGTELARKLRRGTAIIFTTAFDRYAVTAFELRALDYLLKPFGRERFQEAVARLKERLERQDDPSDPKRVAEALCDRRRPVDRVFVRSRGRILAIPVAEIERVQAQDDYVALHVAGREYLLHLPISEIEARLDPARFLRVHRSHVVNMNWIASIDSGDASRLEVQMRDGARVPVSRARTPELRRRTRPA